MNAPRLMIIAGLGLLAVMATAWALLERRDNSAIEARLQEADRRIADLLGEQERMRLDGRAPEAGHVASSLDVSGDAETVRRLEAELAAVRAELAARPVAAVMPDAMRSIPPEERRSWLENLRTSDPQRYQEIMEQREAARQTAKYELAKRAAHFLVRDDAVRSEAEEEQYARMMTLLHESIKLTEQLTPEMPMDERRELGRNLRRNMRELTPMLESERDKELFRIGKDIGYSDDDAASFALYLRDVIDMTSVQSMFRSAMPALGFGWGGGPPGPDRRDAP